MKLDFIFLSNQEIRYFSIEDSILYGFGLAILILNLL